MDYPFFMCLAKWWTWRGGLATLDSGGGLKLVEVALEFGQALALK